MADSQIDLNSIQGMKLKLLKLLLLRMKYGFEGDCLFDDSSFIIAIIMTNT